MADKNKILENAEAWFAAQDIPNECPKENCNAVDKWRHGPVTKVNRMEDGKKVTNPELYVVALTCEWCGHHESTYEEEVPL